jgi:undecaprenyl-diphosphatase
MNFDFLLILKAIIMGIVEGITEFLPISSTGHMIVVGSLIGFNDDFAKKLFDIVIQFGAIIAIIVLYRNKIWQSLKNLKPGQFGFKLWIGIIMAVIPSGIVAVLFYSDAEKLLMFPIPVACALIVGGIALLVAENIYKNNKKTTRSEDVTPFQGFVIGVFQCLSFLWPGFSRSASTIIGGWVVGMTTAAAAEFTFFLAIPTMFGASGYSLLKALKDHSVVLDSNHIVALIVGFVVAFIVALVVVKKFIDYLKHKPLRVFAYYRIVVGVLILTLTLTGVVNLQ